MIEDHVAGHHLDPRPEEGDADVAPIEGGVAAMVDLDARGEIVASLDVGALHQAHAHQLHLDAIDLLVRCQVTRCHDDQLHPGAGTT